MQSPPVVAVVGATGAAGGTLLRVLEDRLFPIGDFRAFASARSAGALVRFRDHDVPVAEVDDAGLAGADIVFFAAGANTSRRFAPVVAAGGGVAVDKSSAYRLDPAVPLVVPEVNAEALDRQTGIVANPNCVTIPLAVVLAPLHSRFGLRHLTVATYQAASGGGRALAAELGQQERDDAYGRPPRKEVYPHVLHGNVVPGGWSMVGDETEEEVKVTAEFRRVLDLAELSIAVTTVRVPVAVGHSAAVWVEFDNAVEADEARRILSKAPGVLVVDDPATQQYPTPRAVAGSDEVHVGRIRADRSRENGLALFLAADNLRKGAATNAVQVAELLLC
ncbi:MAG: aspartate-semialdehyde dehydrogenase [Candidatus Dormibacteraeota bacterium]|uniref:Aspartate-semialdehyde dehydrogenase n=1 Tax=Candidatus Aeolococcus gillhamiae TaxID=3127015 RepID=A0A2W5Z617_9BACT|nr:aspartate-semialdehyde dehydrogenase [Candidatus Dormibacteraeota bacterium]PZR78166.1 MAG: aspartate-semialdehyde dehydrogenase [Candidatus Dormibacter sp. RRmetagenome_bin12]